MFFTWLNGILRRFQQSYHGDSSHYSCLSWVSPVLGWGSEVSCPRTLPRKNPEDLVRLEPRTPRLRVKHFTTKPRRTPCFSPEKGQLKWILYNKRQIQPYPYIKCCMIRSGLLIFHTYLLHPTGKVNTKLIHCIYFVLPRWHLMNLSVKWL